MPLFAEQGKPMMRLSTYSKEDEARVMWKWIGENGEYERRQG
jgi:hypothetical protein